MENFILVVHVLIAIAMTGFILLQQGKGAEMGASFGAGSSQTVFGSAGSAGFLTKATAVLALIFFATSITPRRKWNRSPCPLSRRLRWLKRPLRPLPMRMCHQRRPASRWLRQQP